MAGCARRALSRIHKVSVSSFVQPAVTCAGLSFHWPDGDVVLDGVDVTFPRARTGLIGDNGSGKSTLLRLLAGQLAPTAGTIAVAGEVGYLPQDMTLQTEQPVAELLGIAKQLAALRAIESGDASATNIATVGEDWDVEERARAQLARFGLPVDLDRVVGSLSGGEAVLAGLVGLLLRRPAVALLDEPTNNLDRPARELLYKAVDDWQGALVVVSHDRELLERVDQIAELREATVRTYGGGFSSYQEQLAAEQAAARRRMRDAEADVRREQRQLIEARTKLARRERYARTDAANKRKPKIVMNQRKQQAQISAGKHRSRMQDDLDDARQSLEDAQGHVRDDDRIHIDLPGTVVPNGRTLVTLSRAGVELSVRGPERIGMVGRNGSGKTTLLRAITGTPLPDIDVAPVEVPMAYLPQRLDILDDSASVLNNIRHAAPKHSYQQVRAQLARFLITGDDVYRPASTLSGGERFRVSLARLLLADPPPVLLLLDEPTNNLDLASVEHLIEALACYRGALIVASHDQPFLEQISIDTWWSL